MVMVRCTGVVCAFVRSSECARATARSIDVAVASRCAAAMNASASCWLSVPSAWRSSAAMRASILSSLTPRRLLRQSRAIRPNFSLASHAARLGLLPDKDVERRDHLWRKRTRLGEVGDVVAGIVVQHMVDALKLDDFERGVLERIDEGLLGVARSLTVAVRTRQKDRGARGQFGGQRLRIDLVCLDDGSHVARVDDRVEPL